MANLKWKYVAPLKNGKDASCFELEDKYNYTLPEELKACIKKYNGGTPNKTIYKTKDNELVFSGLLSFNRDDEDSVYTFIELFEKDDKSLDMFPFGIDPFGNFFCIKDNKIVFYDHEEDDFSVIADGFSAFLEGLE